MKFLKYSTIRIGLDYDLIHSLTTEEILDIRNRLRDMRELRKLTLDATITFNGEYSTVRMNCLESELIESLDSIIIKRRLEEREKKRKNIQK